MRSPAFQLSDLLAFRFVGKLAGWPAGLVLVRAGVMVVWRVDFLMGGVMHQSKNRDRGCGVRCAVRRGLPRGGPDGRAAHRGRAADARVAPGRWASLGRGPAWVMVASAGGRGAAGSGWPGVPANARCRQWGGERERLEARCTGRGARVGRRARASERTRAGRVRVISRERAGGYQEGEATRGWRFTRRVSRRSGWWPGCAARRGLPWCWRSGRPGDMRGGMKGARLQGGGRSGCWWTLGSSRAGQVLVYPRGRSVGGGLAASGW